jgi:hypothetical protein
MNNFKISRHTFYDKDAARDQRLRVHQKKIFATLDSETLAYGKGLENRDDVLLNQDSGEPKMTILDDPAPEWLRMHMCVIFAPWVDRSSSTSEQGLFCTTCLYTEHEHVLYDKQNFLKHVENCRVGPYHQGYVVREIGLYLLKSRN